MFYNFFSLFPHSYVKNFYCFCLFYLILHFENHIFISFQFHLEQDEGNNVLMKKLFNVLMTFLRIGQSETVLGHVFASLRSFMHKFPSVLFHGSANVCGVLCYEVSLHLHEQMNFLFLILHYSFLHRVPSVLFHDSDNVCEVLFYSLFFPS